MKLTAIEQLILHITLSRPHKWLNCSGRYIGEVLALQYKGLLTSRTNSAQLQVRALTKRSLAR